MAKVMVTFQAEGPAPTIAELQRRFSLTDDEIDRSFGVIEVDPQDHTFTILVEESAAQKVQPGGPITKVAGPFSNPRIEPFGPPER